MLAKLMAYDQKALFSRGLTKHGDVPEPIAITPDFSRMFNR
jgi:hypothetical protein